MGIRFRNQKTKYTMGEMRAIISPFIGADPEEVKAILLFGFVGDEIRVGACMPGAGASGGGEGEDAFNHVMHMLAHYLSSLYCDYGLHHCTNG